MNISLVAITVGVLVFVGLMLGLNGLFKKRLNLGERLRNTPKGNAEDRIEAIGKRLLEFFKPLGEMLPRSPAEMSRQEKKLVQAGIRRKDAVIVFYSVQFAMAILAALAFTVSGYMYQQTILCLILSIFFGAVVPDIWLKRRTSQRKLEIQNGLPDAMDLAVVAVEAGLGLDQALLRVGDEMRMAYPALSDELHLRNLEVHMGRSRSDALRNLAERTGVEDMKILVAILIQTDKFGTSIGQALRTFSDSLRTKRRQRAEEMAAKLAIKMIVPMVVFIFPAVFVVVIGPALIGIVRELLPAMSVR